ncbi:transposase family protein [Maribacter polysiphoniae]|uniref:Integrase-like protein n=1 Tax=Maribacter polysiphoniae TaxID=429344 RepID=A0A316E2A3_9FLAO|nr:DDE-type integrase/transposase/recombinase [Maribacter polysiphoniae]MBD1261521.1 transposase family protein [Maribacter polysiphoniae]PWK22853.1 integrase-like protein [Maribacter polysiphoniae]
MEKGYLRIINNDTYVSKQFLVDNGYNPRTLENHLSRYNKGKAFSFANKKELGDNMIWIFYNSIPKNLILKYGLPRNSDEAKKILNNAIPDDLDRGNSYWEGQFKKFWFEKGNWVRYLPMYSGYLLGENQKRAYAKTHYIVNLTIRLRYKGVPKIELYNAYMKLPHIIFKTNSYRYFWEKMKQCEKKGIPETLIHDFKINGREPYKVSIMVRGLIQLYYGTPKGYNIPKIHKLVNSDLRARGLLTISLSTVYKICSDVEMKNRWDALRYGKAYAKNNLFPYLEREEPEAVGDVYEIDSTRINFPFKEDGEIRYLNLCAMMDVHTRKIVGYSFADSENFEAVKECLKIAFIENHVVPNHIVCDNGSAYTNYKFENLTNLLNDFGVNVRHCKVDNPGDKGHIERWFGILQESYLNNHVGFLGEGIKSKRKNGRKNRHLEALYKSKKYLISRIEFIDLIKEEINNYNTNYSKVVDGIPDKLFRAGKKGITRTFKNFDIAFIFGKMKRIKVSRSKVKFVLDGRKYAYTIWSSKWANKLNRTKVHVYYQPLAMEEINLFDSQGNFLINLQRDKSIKQITYTNNEIKAYQHFHEKMTKRIKDNFEGIFEKAVDTEEYLSELPNLSMDDELIEKMKAIRMQDKGLIRDALKDYRLKELDDKGFFDTIGNNPYTGELKIYTPKPKRNTKFKILKDETTSKK